MNCSAYWIYQRNKIERLQKQNKQLVDVCRKALHLGEDHLPGCACMGCKTKREIRAALTAVDTQKGGS